MKTSFSFLLGFALLLSSCGGLQTVRRGAVPLSYNSAVWEVFSNEVASGLNVKNDESCWIDLNGDLTTPRAEEDLVSAVNGFLTIYSDSAEDPSSKNARYVSFPVGDETVYARVSAEHPDACVRDIEQLSVDTLGE